MAPRTSLAIQTFNSLTLVAKIETLFVGMYNFFTHSPKQAFEASKLVELLECKENKILKMLFDPLDFYVVAIQVGLG
jgi:hypothetical protein